MEGNYKCKLKLYSKRNKRAPLLITDFSHGEVKNGSSLKFECFNKSSSVSNAGPDTSRQLFATNGRLNYSGSSSDSALKYFVGVRNKETGKMKLYDCVLFRMKPDLKEMVDSIESTIPKSHWEGINELTKNFGSKAKKRALDTLQKCSVDTSLDKSLTVDDSILLSSPNKSISDGTHPQIDYLPPQDRNAPVPSEVFDLNDVISPEEDVALNQEAQDLLIAPAAAFNEKSSSFCKYVAERFHNVDATKAKLLLYYNYLIIFQQLKYADIRRKDPTPLIPNPHKKHLLEKFTLSSSNDKGRVSRTCPNQMKDKIVAYILVLALFIDDFKISLDKLIVDLSNVGVLKLKTIAEVLGCHTGKNKMGAEMVNYAELRIPLNEVTPRFTKKPSSRKY